MRRDRYAGERTDAIGSARTASPRPMQYRQHLANGIQRPKLSRPSQPAHSTAVVGQEESLEAALFGVLPSAQLAEAARSLQSELRSCWFGSGSAACSSKWWSKSSRVELPPARSPPGASTPARAARPRPALASRAAKAPQPRLCTQRSPLPLSPAAAGRHRFCLHERPPQRASPAAHDSSTNVDLALPNRAQPPRALTAPPQPEQPRTRRPLRPTAPSRQAH